MIISMARTSSLLLLCLALVGQAAAWPMILMSCDSEIGPQLCLGSITKSFPQDGVVNVVTETIRRSETGCN